MTNKPTYDELEQKVRDLERQVAELVDGEKALRESDKRFRLLSDSTFEAIVVHEGGVLIEANDQFFKMFGYEPQELVGKQVIPSIVAIESKNFMKKQIQSETQTPYHSFGIKKDG